MPLYGPGALVGRRNPGAMEKPIGYYGIHFEWQGRKRRKRWLVTNYARGAALERKCKAALESMGYSCARSAGSKGGADIWCLREDGGLLIQVKGYKLSPAELDKASAELRAIRHPSNVRLEIWYRYDKDWDCHYVVG